MPAADETDAALAVRLADEAGAILLELRQRLTSQGAPRWAVMDEGDATAHHHLARALADARPEDAVLSEEGRDSRARLSVDRVWIVDPLDGTNEYGEPGRTEWAVHVALCVRGVPVVGAVALPAVGITLASDPAPVLAQRTRAKPRIVTSRWHVPYAAVTIADALDADMVHLGGAGAKAMAVVLGHADIYAHHGGMYEWDSAAPAAVALAAGLHVSRLDGSPLVYNRSDPWLPDLLVCRRELAGDVLEALWS